MQLELELLHRVNCLKLGMLQATSEADRIGSYIYKMPNFENFFICRIKVQDPPECISPEKRPFDRSQSPPALKSALLKIYSNGKLNTLMNQDGVDDRYPFRWLTAVNRISCGGGFWPWFRETPLKDWLASAVSGADSAGVSPQPGPFR
ncbi:hypothetical protein QQF64_013111 [Cirrhinus molitorella]|uniref:Uncharacterized protein n=1 Tax=Cirrhinus molitorella TaxID=172907 RepID=A0ABR3LQ79_9TELE